MDRDHASILSEAIDRDIATFALYLLDVYGVALALSLVDYGNGECEAFIHPSADKSALKLACEKCFAANQETSKHATRPN